ncbi:unnamed protein product [Phyllotreta striolata]|uniref:Lysosomal Pro-X carboxypeptidase n=1 Tax=Phyllotreta striolata TaxID=444603 RepID=A0A9N9XJU9_PHYSR|nr:unnamed protein product [Phyllotreta striolata]
MDLTIHRFCVVFLIYLELKGTNCEQRFSFETRFAEVPVTHFEWQKEVRTFKLKYLINTKHYVRGGPFFIYLGGRGDIDVYSQNTGFLFEVAATFKGLLVFIEHRYYGRSLPFSNESMTLENLRYMTTSEALGDFVSIIDLLKRETFENTASIDNHPVIVFGGGYSGALAAWMRMKYPFLVLGAIASSAPMIYGSSVKNCECFYDVVTKMFEKYGHEQCVKTIKLGWEVLINLSRSKIGLDFISSTWRLCKRLSSTEDLEMLLEWLGEILVKLALNNYHYPSNFFTPLPAYPLKVFCEKLTTSFFNDTKSLVQYFGQALQVYTNYSGRVSCNEFEDQSDYLYNYQKCVELIMPKCSIDSDMFIHRPWIYEKFALECKNRYGIFNNDADWINRAYGGSSLKYASNIVFSHGELDPYSCYGIRSNVSSTVRAVDITEGSHHVDLRNPDVSDNNYITDVRKSHIQTIKAWLSKI